LGQVGNTFIVASGPEGLVLLDQHAAHESLLYSRLVAAVDAGEELPEPLLLTLTPQQQHWFEAFHAIFPTLNLLLEDFGKDTMLVREVPSALADLITSASLVEAAQEAYQRVGARATVEEAREQLSAALACRTAIRAGDVLTDAQVAGLVEALSAHHLPFTCPHGRPTYVTLSLGDLERRFLRLFPLDTSA
jgi:DNA mismatch repair protein MutL